MNRFNFFSILSLCVLSTTSFESGDNVLLLKKHKMEGVSSSFMNDVLIHIQATYPQTWLSNLTVHEENIGLEISHPNNMSQYLSVDIFPDQVGIAVLEEENRNVLFDLAGFNFVFTDTQLVEAKTFFANHQETGSTK